jgi:uncharacterized protein (DUF488 family)
MAAVAVLTIGHSNHSLEAFVALLRSHGVTACVDVRSSPWSRRVPHFNRETLRTALKEHGVTYLFLGRELGGRPSDPACYEEGRVRYGKVAQTELFKAGLEQVQRGAESDRLALVCAEREPLSCHRTLLVSRELEARGVAVSHIHADGKLETHAVAMSRLLAQLGLAEQDLFRTRKQVIEEAYAVQEDRIAYAGELPSR